MVIRLAKRPVFQFSTQHSNSLLGYHLHWLALMSWKRIFRKSLRCLWPCKISLTICIWYWLMQFKRNACTYLLFIDRVLNKLFYFINQSYRISKWLPILKRVFPLELFEYCDPHYRKKRIGQRSQTPAIHMMESLYSAYLLIRFLREVLMDYKLLKLNFCVLIDSR